MSEVKTWVLTDVRNQLWKEEIVLREDELGVAGCTVSKARLRGGLQDGVDLVEVSNSDLSFSILPTRGMGIWKGSFRGLSLGWKSPVTGPVHPQWVNELDRGGLGWLRGFDECIVRCGLDSNGAPGEDTVLDNNGNPITINLTLHGKIANLPAHYLEVRAHPESESISVVGEVDEASLFLPGLRLRSTIRTTSRSNRLTIEDEVINLKGTPSELELLYHCNFGQPFLEAGSKLLVPFIEAAPRDARAVEGIRQMETYRPPTSGYVEQVYFYDLAANSAQETVVALRNAIGDKAIVLRLNKDELPCFTQWKCTASLSEGYVTGLEPATNYPNPKSFEREQGRVVSLEPGQSYRCSLTLEVCTSSEEVAAVEAEIADLQAGRRPTIHKEPQPGYSLV
jgi:hypothetical protein